MLTASLVALLLVAIGTSLEIVFSLEPMWRRVLHGVAMPAFVAVTVELAWRLNGWAW